MNKKAYVNMNVKNLVRAVHRAEFDVTPPPMSVMGENYRYQHVQGGCEAKGYLYTCMITANPNEPKCCILKQNIQTGELVSYSDEMSLGHANDATYNPDENTIVISLCDGTTRMAILDADTLKLKEIITLEGHVLCNIHYDPVTKIYIAVAVQCEAIYVYDKSFRLIKQFNGFMNRGPVRDYSMQGAMTDGVYVYVLEWHGGKHWAETNVTDEADVKSDFIVFDLATGECAGTIELGIRREIEYATYLNGKFYVGCNNIRWDGLEVYEVEIVASEKD